MRLQEVYAICQNVQNSWCDLAFEEKKGTGNITYYKLSNADNVRGILRDLDPITSFSSNIEEVRKTSVGFTQPTVEVNLDQRAKSILQTEYQRLLNKVLTKTPNRGTCRLHKLEVDFTYLGRDFYYAVVDTVYVKQPTGTPAARTQRSSTARPAASVQASDEAAMTFSVETVPGSEPYTEHTRIRPDGTRTTVRRKGIVTDFRL